MNVYAEVGGSGSRKPIAVPETAGTKGVGIQPNKSAFLYVQM